MIFNMAGAAGGIKYLPLFDGYWNLALSKDGKSGYAEFFSSGTLTWQDGKIPASADITCVGAGGGGSNGVDFDTNDNIYYAGSGGAGGFVNSVFGAALAAETDIAIGSGGLERSAGGTSSVGSFCSANGGGGASSTASPNIRTLAGSGGNAGGVGGVKHNSGYGAAVAGCSNGAQPPAAGYPSGQTVGTSQGSPTVDILGRKHAGGGAGGLHAVSSGSTRVPGGASDCIKHSGTGGTNATGSTGLAGTDPGYGGDGGGGAGGGGGGGGAPTYQATGIGRGGAGGDGLVVIGWGNYASLVA